MSSRFASERRAAGICDRCGQRYNLKVLRNEIVKGNRTSLKVCPECFDEDHPQLFIGDRPVYDPQALRDPRPDNAELAASRALITPVRSVGTRATVGQVTAVVT